MAVVPGEVVVGRLAHDVSVEVAQGRLVLSQLVRNLLALARLQISLSAKIRKKETLSKHTDDVRAYHLTDMSLRVL